MNITGKVVHSLKWLTISKFVGQLLRWTVTFIVIRILAPEDYGLMAMSDVVISFFALFATAGLASALVQVRSFTENQIRELFGLLLTLNLLLAAALLFLAPLASAYYQEPRLTLVLQVLQIGFLITAIETLPSAMLTREMRFKALSLIDLTAGIVASAVTLGLALNGIGVWSLVIGYLFEMVIRAGLKFAAHPIKVLPRLAFRESLPLLTFGGIKTLAAIVWFAFISIDTIIGGRLWSTATLGFYAVAMQLSLIPLNKMVPMLKQVAFPAYANVHRQSEDEIAPYFLKANALAMFITFPIFFGMAATASSFIPLILGDKWLDVIVPASLIPLMLPFRVSQELMDPALEAHGHPQDVLFNWLIVLFIVAPSLFAGAHYGGLPGMCWAWVISLPISFLFSALRTSRRLQLSLYQYLATVGRPLLCALVMFAVVKAIHYWGWNHLSSLLLLALEVGLGGLTYLLCSRMLCSDEITHLVGLLKKLRQP